MSPQERQWRSELAKLVSSQAFLHGTPSVRLRTCGGLNCRCTRGHKHRSLYVVAAQGKRFRQLYVSRHQEPAVRQWIQNEHRIRELMQKISDLYWQRVIQNRRGRSYFDGS